MPRPETIQHLKALYDSDVDPWRHLSSIYECSKYERTLEIIGKRKFSSCLEVGCGIGGFSTHLSELCSRLICMECIPSAAARARVRLEQISHVSVHEGTAPDDIPDCRPDLVVLSEVLYFLTVAEINRLGTWINQQSTADAVVIAATWTGPTEQELTGTESIRLLSQNLRTWKRFSRLFTGYRLDRFDRDRNQS